MKTVEEWLSMLVEPYRSAALQSVEPRFKKIQEKSIQNALLYFNWSGCPLIGGIKWLDICYYPPLYMQNSYTKYLKPIGAKVEVLTQTK